MEFPCSQLGGHAPACSGVSGTAFGLAFAGFALHIAGGAVLLLGFHIADEIVRRASALAEAQATVCQGNMLTTRQCFLRGSNTRIIGLGRFLVL